MLKFHHETFEGSLAIVKTMKNQIVQNLVSDDIEFIEFVNLIVKEYVLNCHMPYISLMSCVIISAVMQKEFHIVFKQRES